MNEPLINYTIAEYASVLDHLRHLSRVNNLQHPFEPYLEAELEVIADHGYPGVGVDEAVQKARLWNVVHQDEIAEVERRIA